MENKETDLPCCLRMPSGHYDPRKPTRGARQTPQRREVVMVAEAEDEGVAEEVAVNPMQIGITTKEIQAK